MNAQPNPPRRLQLVWSTKAMPAAPLPPSLRVAFASNDRSRVNQHFGAAEGFVIHEVSADKNQLIAVAEFPPEAMDGNEDKLATKIDFLAGCAAVFVMAIGASAIKQLMASGIQPVRVTGSDRIDNILAEIQNGIKDGGVAWIDKALVDSRKDAGRFDRMAEEGWEG
ncbi:MAG: nitrogen fixation protein NifX [Rhodocyclaceae bacterium]|nr:nitrogen fixation protein NifX [Rhodocyclaceae bacterium]